MAADNKVPDTLKDVENAEGKPRTGEDTGERPQERFEAQVLHKRTYGNKLVFLDVHRPEKHDRPEQPDAEDEAGLECVFAFEVYGDTVRTVRKDICVGDVVEFEGVYRECGRILDVVKYRMVQRWRDAGKGEHFRALKVSRPHGRGADARGRPGADGDRSMAFEEIDITSGLKLCKFWMSNGDCRRLECGCAHPEGDALKEARGRYWDSQQKRKASNADPNDPHGIEGKKSHGHRAAVFADWLCTIFGLEALQADGVVDIAGGRGELAFELSVKRQVPCTVVDPRCSGEELQVGSWTDFKLARPQRLWLQSKVPGLRTFHECQAYVASCPLRKCNGFVTKGCADAGAEHHTWWSRVVGNCRVIVGLHPDQATGGVVDLALAFDRPFAVVPCCTFADDFPERILNDGRPVRTYDDLVAWLRARSPDTEVGFLGFQGKNLTVFSRHQPSIDVQVLPDEKRQRIEGKDTSAASSPPAL